MDVGAPRSTPRPHPNPLPAGEGGKTSPPRLYSSPRVGCTRVSRGGEAGGKGSGRPREAPLREGLDSRFRGNDGYGRREKRPPGARTPAGARPLSVSPRGGLCVTGASGSMDVGAPRSTPRPHPNPLPAGEGGKTSPPRLYSSPRVGCTRVSRGGEAGGKGSGLPREAPLREGMDSRFRGNDGYGRREKRPLSVSPRGGLCVTGASGSMDVGAPRSTPRPHPNPLPAGEGGKTSPPRLYSSPRVGCTRVSRGGEAGGKGSGRPREAPLREGMDSRFRGNDGYGRVSQGSPLEPRRPPILCVLPALSARMTQVAADQFVGVS